MKNCYIFLYYYWNIFMDSELSPSEMRWEGMFGIFYCYSNCYMSLSIEREREIEERERDERRERSHKRSLAHIESRLERSWSLYRAISTLISISLSLSLSVFLSLCLSLFSLSVSLCLSLSLSLPLSLCLSVVCVCVVVCKSIVKTRFWQQKAINDMSQVQYSCI